MKILSIESLVKRHDHWHAEVRIQEGFLWWKKTTLKSLVSMTPTGFRWTVGLDGPDLPYLENEYMFDAVQRKNRNGKIASLKAFEKRDPLR